MTRPPSGARRRPVVACAPMHFDGNRFSRPTSRMLPAEGLPRVRNLAS